MEERVGKGKITFIGSERKLFLIVLTQIGRAVSPVAVLETLVS
jgi:hypothetical protein